MRFMPTMLMFVLAGLAASAMVWTIREDAGPARAGGAETTLSLASMLPVDQIQRIDLQRGEETPLVFERAGGQWSQVEPFAHPMELFSIHQLAALAGQLEIRGPILPVVVGPGMSDETFGLAPPRASVRYEWPGGELTLELGRLVGAGRGYLRVGGQETIYSVDQTLHARAILMDPKEWRDRHLFHNVNIDAQAISRVVGDDRLVMHRERRQWTMAEPVIARVGDEALQTLLQAIDSATAGGYIADQPEDLAAFGLEPPAAIIEVITTRRFERDGQVVTEPVAQRLLVGAPMATGGQERFAMMEGRPVVFRLGMDTQARLFVQSAAMAAPSASGTLPADVKTLVIQTSEQELRLERNLERWVAPNVAGRAVDARLVNNLLAQLTQLRPEAIRIAPYPVESQVATITMVGFNQRPIDTVRIARDAETDRWILENGDNVLRLFPKSVQFRLLPADFGLVSILPEGDGEGDDEGEGEATGDG